MQGFSRQKKASHIGFQACQVHQNYGYVWLASTLSHSLMGSFGKGSLRKLCHSTLVYQSFLTATLIAALHCISSCHNQASIESLWNDCSWFQVGRQYSHSICTLQLSTATHSAAHYDPPHALQTALREDAEILRNYLWKFFQNRFYCASEGCGNFAEIR